MALQQGADGKDALLYGTMSGIVDAVTDRIEVGRLFDLVSSPQQQKKLLRTAFEQAGVSVTEQMISDTAGLLFEDAILGENSRFNQRKNALIAQG